MNDILRLQVLQELANMKLESYRNKWSKSSTGQIKQLEKSFNDLNKLTKYFTKR
jgi:hypothetical protein